MNWLIKTASTISVAIVAMTATAYANTTVMQCQLENGREVNVTWNGENLEYVYGKSGKAPEIELPNNPNDFYTMTYGHQSFASSEAVHYRFTNGKYDYVTYFSETGQGTISNLGIFKDKKLIKQIKCKDYFHTDLKNIYQPVSDKINEENPNGDIDWTVNIESNNDTTGPQENQPPQQTPDAQPTEALVKVSVGQKSSVMGNMEHVYRVVNVTGLADSVTVNQVSVNRGQCRASSSNPKTAYKLPFGATKSYSYMIHNGMTGDDYNCDVVEIVVSTNMGNWTFKPNQ